MMTPKRKIIWITMVIAFLGYLLIGCDRSRKEPLNQPMGKTYTIEATDKIQTTNKNFNAPDDFVCKAIISKVMGRPINIIKINQQLDGIYYLSYIRKSDRTEWRFKCRIEGRKGVWGTAKGRWREGPYDGTILLRTEGSKLFVKEKFSDGSEGEETFNLPKSH